MSTDFAQGRNAGAAEAAANLSLPPGSGKGGDEGEPRRHTIFDLIPYATLTSIAPYPTPPLRGRWQGALTSSRPGPPDLHTEAA